MRSPLVSTLRDASKKILGNTKIRNIAYPLLCAVGLMGLAGCDSDATKASRNIS